MVKVGGGADPRGKQGHTLCPPACRAETKDCYSFTICYRTASNVSKRQASFRRRPAYAKAMTDRSNEQVYFKERREGCWEAPDHLRVGVGMCMADNRVPMRRPSKHKARPYLCFR
jgi:hypothetical protein